LGPATIRDWRLVFRGVADIEPSQGASVQGALWSITPRCERALDRYEGYPRLYGKRHTRRPGGGRVMLYVMNDQDWISTPGKHYLNVIREGYQDFGLDLEALMAAFDHAMENQIARSRDAG
jgi:gamma-glutamylcyclotransferase (GGCT)/AIG2-like uncharacterized protein YtfP